MCGPHWGVRLALGEVGGEWSFTRHYGSTYELVSPTDAPTSTGNQGRRPIPGGLTLLSNGLTTHAETLTADALQALMRHKSYQTTQRYINMARQLNRAVDALHVPDVRKNAAG